MPVPEVTLDLVTQAAKEAVQQHNFPVSVIGAVRTDGESDYVEVLLRVKGCHTDPCQLQIGVFRRGDFDDVRAQIADQIRRHLSAR